MDTRDTAEQAELRRTAGRLARELGPATVADLADATRRKRLASAIGDAGWTELRDDAGDGSPLTSGAEAAIVAEALGATVADAPFLGPLLAADLGRRVGVPTDGAAVVFAADLLGAAVAAPDGRLDPPGFAVDAASDVDAALALVADGSGWALGRVDIEPTTGVLATTSGANAPVNVETDLTRAIRRASGTVDAIDGQRRTLTVADLEHWRALGLALTSADLVGVMRGVLELTVAYASDRHQYGVPIGSFQAVQHLLADARTLMEGSLSVALHAAWAVDALEPSDAVAAGRVAKAYCSRAARTVCETAIQVHGGIGNTWECLAHVYLRRALLSAQWFGDDGEQLRALQDECLGVTDGLP